MRGKLIVIEGTDCSGKETQSNLLLKRLREEGIRAEKFSFPNYTSPTGKIIGGPYLGKRQIANSYFKEGASHVDPIVSSLYYAADRKYNIHKITWLLENGVHVLLDRYVYSNMAHQGGKLREKEERLNMYHFLSTLEFELLHLPKPDIALFLHVPLAESLKLRGLRDTLDEHEKDIEHLKNAELAYLEISKMYAFHTVECVNQALKTISEIHDEIYKIVKQNL